MVGSLVVSIALLARVAVDNAPNPVMFDTARIEQLTGAQGKLDEKAGVFTVIVPRSDLKVAAAGVRLTSPMGLTSWAAFKRTGSHTTLTGDVVLTEEQVNPVMSAALEHGLEVTALHNRFFWDTPRIMLMRIAGKGAAEDLAAGVGAAFAATRATAGGREPVGRADIDPARSTLDPKKLDAAFGRYGAFGDYNDGVYRMVVGRSNTWAALAGSDERAVIDGDFAVLESELQPVLKALRKGGINVVAIDQHFLHYWGIGRAADLAATVVSALGQTKRDATP